MYVKFQSGSTLTLHSYSRIPSHFHLEVLSFVFALLHHESHCFRIVYAHFSTFYWKDYHVLCLEDGWRGQVTKIKVLQHYHDCPLHLTIFISVWWPQQWQSTQITATNAKENIVKICVIELFKPDKPRFFNPIFCNKRE